MSDYDKRHRIFEFLGTRPAMLQFVAQTISANSIEERVEQLIDDKLMEATNVLLRLCTQARSPSGEDFRRLIIALLIFACARTSLYRVQTRPGHWRCLA